jgi:hypothetical protein
MAEGLLYRYCSLHIYRHEGERCPADHTSVGVAQDRQSVLPSRQLLHEHTAAALRNADTSKAYRPIKASATSRLCQPRNVPLLGLRSRRNGLLGVVSQC